MVDKLSPSQIYTLLLQGGFAPDDARTMTAIAQAESARNPAALGDIRLEDGKWGPSVGLFQIRTVKAETGHGTERDIEHLMGHPAAQVKSALSISDGGNNFRPWSTYTSGSYRKFLDEPLHDGASLDGLDGLDGSHGGLGGSGDSGDLFSIDRGAPARITEADHDGDGLTDRFERLLGTDARAVDTDHDGLSDAYETTNSHTDPLVADTDHDGVADATELAQGGDAGHADIPAAAAEAGFGGLDNLDRDHDGLSDGYEKRHGTNPLLADTDHDGLSDAEEIARGTDPHSIDSDHDGLSDGFSAQHGIDPPADAPDDVDLDLHH
jgi:hypothetical protein